MDTSRSVSPVTFMSNMTYACSILYKTKLPFIVAMNKVKAEKLYFFLLHIKLNTCIVYHANPLYSYSILPITLQGH